MPGEDNEWPDLSQGGAADDAGDGRGGSPLSPGEWIDDFEIIEEVGRGGMGIVYRAYEKSLRRVVALKILHPGIADDPSAAKRFRREAVLAANLSHPNIVTALHIDEQTPARYFAMEFVEGQSIKQKVSGDGYLQAVQAARIALQAAEALDYAHRHSVIHRDIKPSNILLENHIERVRITDFGIAQDVTGNLMEITVTGSLTPGTPAFMSPEQNLGNSLDGRTDIFSLGMTLYYMLTGQVAYRAENRQQLALAFMEQRPRPPSRFNADVDATLDSIVLRMIAVAPDRRWTTAAEVARRLRSYIAYPARSARARRPSARRQNAETAAPPKSPHAVDATPADSTGPPRSCRIRLFLFGAMSAAFLVLCGARLLPLKYTAVTTFRRGIAPTAQQSAGLTAGFDRDRLTLPLELAGYAAVANAAEELNLIMGERDLDGKLKKKGELEKQQFVNKLKSGVGVRWDLRSDKEDLVSVGFTHEAPDIAEKMPNTLVKNYINQRSQKTLDTLESSMKFLEQQVKAGKAQVRELKDEKIRFETYHAGGIFDSPGAIQDLILQHSTQLDTLRVQEKTLTETRSELEDRTAEYEALQSGSGGDPTSRRTKQVYVPNEEKKNLISQLERDEEILKDELLIKEEKHPRIKELQASIDDLKARIEKMPDKLIMEEVIELKQIEPPPDRRDELKRTKRELARAKLEIERVEGNQKDLARALANFTKTHQDYEKITIALTEKQKTLKEWESKLRAVSADFAAQLNNIGIQLSMWQAVQKQVRPASPSLAWVLVTTAVVALVGGLAMAAVPIRIRRLGRIIVTVAAPVLLLALLVTLLSVKLRLTDVRAFRDWKEDATGFLAEKIQEGKISDLWHVEFSQPEPFDEGAPVNEDSPEEPPEEESSDRMDSSESSSRSGRRGVSGAAAKVAAESAGRWRYNEDCPTILAFCIGWSRVRKVP